MPHAPRPQEKEAKVAYLQKIIDVVGQVLGQPVPAKPSKVGARGSGGERTQRAGLAQRRPLQSPAKPSTRATPHAHAHAQIVAGLEPENTNVFLQMLGRACRMNNGAQAVQVRAACSTPLRACMHHACVYVRAPRHAACAQAPPHACTFHAERAGRRVLQAPQLAALVTAAGI